MTFAPLTVEMVNRTAALHVEYMPNDLTSKLGLSAVRDIFHLGTLNYPGGIGIAAVSDGALIGFCLAHIDFGAFSKFQKRDLVRFYRATIPGLLRTPSLAFGILGARKYLKMHPQFVNLGPLLVHPDFRTPDAFAERRVSVAGELARMTFASIREKARDWPVLTMIRPDNMPSISAVAQGAARGDYKLAAKSSIAFGADIRTVYEYRAKPTREKTDGQP